MKNKEECKNLKSQIQSNKAVHIERTKLHRMITANSKDKIQTNLKGTCTSILRFYLLKH